jgi:hypothetical protein
MTGNHDSTTAIRKPQKTLKKPHGIQGGSSEIHAM